MPTTYNGKAVVAQASVLMSDKDMVVVNDTGHPIEIMFQQANGVSANWGHPTPTSSRITVNTTGGGHSIYSSIGGTFGHTKVEGYYSVEFLRNVGGNDLYRVSFVLHEA